MVVVLVVVQPCRGAGGLQEEYEEKPLITRFVTGTKARGCGSRGIRAGVQLFMWISSTCVCPELYAFLYAC